MPKKEKKDFTKSKKFFEIQQERQNKLFERSVQKKTSYERDIRTMLKMALEPLRAAEEGRAEITREELNKIRQKVEKILIRIRVLSGNKGANLAGIMAKVQNEKALICDYIQGKKPLPGLVKEKGQGPLQQISQPQTTISISDNGQQQTTESFRYKRFEDIKSDSEQDLREKSKEEFYRSLGFDVEKEPEEEQFIEAQPVSNQIVRLAGETTTFQPTEAFRRMSLNVIDAKMSQIISEGIEHLMLVRKKKGKTNVNYRDEIIKFADDEIVYKKNQTIEELRSKGYSEQQIAYFADLWDKEFELNINLIIRKCLYLSRVLEYRKGSTSTG